MLKPFPVFGHDRHRGQLIIKILFAKANGVRTEGVPLQFLGAGLEVDHVSVIPMGFRVFEQVFRDRVTALAGDVAVFEGIEDEYVKSKVVLGHGFLR